MAMTMAEAGRRGGLVRSEAKKAAARARAAARRAPAPEQPAPAPTPAADNARPIPAVLVVQREETK